MRPADLVYRASFLTAEEEAALLARIEQIEFRDVKMHRVIARRRVIHYGWDYDYEGWKIFPADPVPVWLQRLVARAENEAQLAAGSLEQLMIARYPPGATIGWHRDAPMFGTPVVGISLLAPCTMKFRRKAADGWETHAQLLEPRSLYLLGGEVRQRWQHSIPAVKELRYSISMRTLRRK